MSSSLASGSNAPASTARSYSTRAQAVVADGDVRRCGSHDGAAIVVRKPAPCGPAWVRPHFFRFAGAQRPFGGCRTARISVSSGPGFLWNHSLAPDCLGALLGAIASGPPHGSVCERAATPHQGTCDEQAKVLRRSDSPRDRIEHGRARAGRDRIRVAATRRRPAGSAGRLGLPHPDAARAARGSRRSTAADAEEAEASRGTSTVSWVRQSSHRHPVRAGVDTAGVRASPTGFPFRPHWSQISPLRFLTAAPLLVERCRFLDLDGQEAVHHG